MLIFEIESDRVTISDPRVKSGTVVDPNKPKVSVSKSDLIQRTEKQKKDAANSGFGKAKTWSTGTFQDKRTGEFKRDYSIQGQDTLEKQRQAREKDSPTLAGRKQVAKPGLPGSTSVRQEMEREIEDNRLRQGLSRQTIDADARRKWGTDEDPVIGRMKNPESNVRRFGVRGTQDDKGGWKVRQSDITKKKWAAAHRGDKKYGSYSNNLDKKRVLKRYAEKYPYDKNIQKDYQDHIKYMDRPRADNIRTAIKSWDNLDDAQKGYFNPFKGGLAGSFLKRNPELTKEIEAWADRTGQSDKVYWNK